MLAARLVVARQQLRSPGTLRLSTSPGPLRLSTSPGHGRMKRPGDGDLFRPEDVHRFSREDGVEGDFSLIYREATSFKTHKTMQVVGCATPVLPFYAGWTVWPDGLLFGTLLGPVLLAGFWSLLSAYNLRMFYQVPRRLYFSQTKGSYIFVLNRLLPWRRPVSYAFGPEDLKQVEAGRSGWRVHGITKFHLAPLQRTVWLDRQSFLTATHYWALCHKG